MSERESNGEITEIEGFSVVAATSTTQRFSTPGSRASCCALLKRWISSRNKMVVRPYRSRLSSAWSMTRLTSFTPAEIADSSTNFRLGACEMKWASVVFPVPGGPYNMIDDGPTELGPWVSVSLRKGDPG